MKELKPLTDEEHAQWMRWLTFESRAIDSGWQCPRCLHIYAPSVLECSACKLTPPPPIRPDIVRFEQALQRAAVKLSELQAQTKLVNDMLREVSRG